MVFELAELTVDLYAISTGIFVRA